MAANEPESSNHRKPVIRNRMPAVLISMFCKRLA